MDTKTFSMCIIGKHINKFYKRFSECKVCNRTRGSKRYYKKKMKYYINKNYITKKIEIIYYYRNKTIDVNKLKT